MPQPQSTPDLIDRQVGELIQLRRRMMGLSQKRLGEAIGVSHQQVQKYETGDNRVAASTLVAIGKALQCPATAFLPSDKAAEPDAASPWPQASAEARDLLIWFQDVPQEFRRSFVRICQRLAEPA